MRRAPRVLVTGALLAVSVSGLAACRTSPDVAAYVGDEQVTVAELEAAVEERLADPAVAEYAAGNEAEFTRRVLGLLVQEEIYEEAAERYDVRVEDGDVRRRIDELLGEDDPDAVYGQLAAQGIGREDVFENVRQQLVRRELAAGEGQVDGLDEAELRARYEEVREELARIEIGYVTVPDQATADAVLGQLTAAPDRYAEVAARFAGPYTLPALEPRAPEDFPGPLAQPLTDAAPGTGFTIAVPETGGVVVGFRGETVYPSFEELRPQLEQEVSAQVDEVGGALVEEVRDDLEITVNPRFGRIDETGALVPREGGVVNILEDDDAAAAPAE